MKKLIVLSVLFFVACEKEEVEITTTVIEHSNEYEEKDTLEIMEYKEDTIINQVGCYYPLYPKNK